MDTDIGCAASQKGDEMPILPGETSDGRARTVDEVSQLELMEENALFAKDGLARTNAEISEKELRKYKALLATSLEYSESQFGDWVPYLCAICHNGISDHDTAFCPFMTVATQVRDKPAVQKSGDVTDLSSAGDVTDLSSTERCAADKPAVQKAGDVTDLSSAGDVTDMSSAERCATDKPAVQKAGDVTDLSSAERCAADLMRQQKMNLVRIRNHLKYEYEEKLEMLFKRFGCVTHVYVDHDEGYGFVNFTDRIDASTAIRKLNGYAFEDLSLRVECATLSPEIE